MADERLIRALDEQVKVQKEQSKLQISQIEQLIEQGKGDAAQRVKLLKMQAALQKDNRTLSGDLGKNITNMVDGFSTTVDGMINQTFGPLGGMVTSLTTGFFKRGKENRDNLAQNQLQNENSEKLISELGGVKEAVKSLDKKTPKRDLDKENAGKQAGEALKKAGFKGVAGAKPVSEGGIVDKVIDGVTTAAGVTGGVGSAAGIKALGGKYKSLATRLTGGVAGKVLSKANPVFAAVLMGKDVFDVANAVTDDDVKTSVKNEDIGALIGGFIGGAIGIIGGPAGVALGIGLGNMAGEFIGGAMDSPEIVGAINEVKTGLTAERGKLVAEIDLVNEKLKDKNISAEMKSLYEEQLRQNNARIKSIDGELESMKVLDEDLEKLKEIDVRASAIAKERSRLKRELEIANEKGDTARIAFLERSIEITNKEFEKEEAEYAKKAEELRKKAQQTTKALSEKSTSFFDRVATEGGFFGAAAEFFGLGKGLTGEAKIKYDEQQKDKEKTDLDLRIQRTEAQIQKIIERRKEMGYEPNERTAYSYKARLQNLKSERAALNGLARGGFIVNQPSYLPGSGIVVGEHGTYGSGLAYGGIADGGPEAVIPLSSPRAGAFIDPMAQSVAGMVMNRLQMERMGGGAGGGGATVVTDARSYETNDNTTVINNPSPIGPMLPNEGRDFVSKVA